MANRYAAVYAMAKKVDISGDDLHKLAYSMTQKKSLKELDDCELAAITERLRVLGNMKARGQKSRNFTHGGNPVTAKQRKKDLHADEDNGLGYETGIRFGEKTF